MLGSLEAVVCTCRLATFLLNAAARSSMRMHVHAVCVMHVSNEHKQHELYMCMPQYTVQYHSNC